MLPAASGGSPAPFGGLFEVVFFCFWRGPGWRRGEGRAKMAAGPRPPSGRGAEGVRAAAAPGRCGEGKRGGEGGRGGGERERGGGGGGGSASRPQRVRAGKSPPEDGRRGGGRVRLGGGSPARGRGRGSVHQQRQGEPGPRGVLPSRCPSALLLPSLGPAVPPQP